MDSTALALTILAAVVAAVLPIGQAVVQRLGQRAGDEALHGLDKLLSTKRATAEEERTRALAQLAEKLPEHVNLAELELSLERLAPKINELVSGPGQRADDPAWKLVQDLVNDYHRQALSQAGIQFWFSVVAAVTGFTLIVYAVLASIQSASLESLLKSFPGAVIEAVAALFFRQAGETRQRATDLYDRLRLDNQRAEAVGLVNSIESLQVRDALKAYLTLHIAGVTSLPNELGDLIRVRDFLAPAETQRAAADTSAATAPPTTESKTGFTKASVNGELNSEHHTLLRRSIKGRRKGGPRDD